MKNLHVKIDDKLFEELKEILPFHSGISHATRIALKNFIREFKSGNISISEALGNASSPPTDKEGE